MIFFIIFYAGMSPIVFILLLLTFLYQIPIRGKINKQDIEKLHEPLVTFCKMHHEHIYVVLVVHEEGLFVKQCTPQGSAFYAQSKGAHYRHDRHHGPGIWIPCMIPRGEGFWTHHQTSIKHVRPHDMFRVSAGSGNDTVLIPVLPEHYAFVAKVESW